MTSGKYEGIAVGFDIDGTITDDNGEGNIWDREIFRYFNVGRMCNSYDFCHAYGLSPQQVKAFCDDRLVHVYANVPIKPRAADTIRDLRAAGIRVYLITARDGEHSNVTESYLEKHGIVHDGIWFEPDKVALCRHLGIGFFADDRTENCLALRDAGIECVMVDAFHNTHVDYEPRVSGWEGISTLAWGYANRRAGNHMMETEATA